LIVVTERKDGKRSTLPATNNSGPQAQSEDLAYNQSWMKLLRRSRAIFPKVIGWKTDKEL